MNNKLTILGLTLLLVACGTSTPTPPADNDVVPDEVNMDMEDMDMEDMDMEDMDMEDMDMEDMDMEDMDMEDSITFLGKSSLVDHTGGFSKFTVNTTGDDLATGTVSVTVDMSSVYSDSDGLTGHLQKEDFFDTANYPEATFTSTSIEMTGDDVYTITGDLTVKGITKSMTVDAMVKDDVLTAEFTFPRKEYGVGNDSYGDKLLDENMPVTVVLSLE